MVVLDFVVMVAVFVDEQVVPSHQTTREANNVVVSSLRGRHQSKTAVETSDRSWCDNGVFADEKSRKYTFSIKEASDRRPSCRSAWIGITFTAGLV